MSVHRHWRMVIPHGQNWNGGVGMADVYLNDGVADRIATVTANFTDFGAAANLMDNNASSVWIMNPPTSVLSYPAILTFDFGVSNEYDITQVRIRALGSPYSSTQARNAPAYFQLQYSDDASTWTTYFWGVMNAYYSLGGTETFNKPTADFSAGARYWAVISQLAQDGSVPVLTEMELHDASGGADITTSGTTIWSGSNYPSAGFAASFMVDNSGFTHWASFFEEDALVLDLSSVEDVREVQLQASLTGSYYDNAPTAGYVLRSSDGRGYEEVTAWTLPSTWTAGAQRLITWEAETIPAVDQLKWPLFVGAL